jgi:hypothetical protein
MLRMSQFLSSTSRVSRPPIKAVSSGSFKRHSFRGGPRRTARMISNCWPRVRILILGEDVRGVENGLGGDRVETGIER